MVGRAVDTIVWSSAASSIPSMMVAKTRFTWRRLNVAGTGSGGALTAVSVVTRSTVRPVPSAGAHTKWATGRRATGATGGQGDVPAPLGRDVVRAPFLPPGPVAGTGAPVRMSFRVAGVRLPSEPGGPRPLGVPR